MRSFASTPGNAFVIPTSSTIGVSVGSLTLVGSVCLKKTPWGQDASCPQGCVDPPAAVDSTAGAATLQDYLISFWTWPALLAAGILIVPLMIFAFAAVISAQVFAGMYFDFSSEMPPFFRLRS